MRLFAALPIAQHLYPQICRLQSGAKGAKWRPPENFHITLQFFGDIQPNEMPRLIRALQNIPVPQLNLNLSGLGAFGGKRPFNIWAGVHGDAPNDETRLHQLAKACAKAAIDAGIAIEQRKYTAHLTLAYCKQMRAIDAAQYFAQMDGYPPISLQTDRFCLYASHLGKGAALYETITAFKSNFLE